MGMQTAEVAFGCAGKLGAPQDMGFHGVLWGSAEPSHPAEGGRMGSGNSCSDGRRTLCYCLEQGVVKHHIREVFALWTVSYPTYLGLSQTFLLLPFCKRIELFSFYFLIPRGEHAAFKPEPYT